MRIIHFDLYLLDTIVAHDQKPNAYERPARLAVNLIATLFTQIDWGYKTLLFINGCGIARTDAFKRYFILIGHLALTDCVPKSFTDDFIRIPSIYHAPVTADVVRCSLWTTRSHSKIDLLWNSEIPSKLVLFVLTADARQSKTH